MFGSKTRRLEPGCAALTWIIMNVGEAAPAGVNPGLEPSRTPRLHGF
jgi:hypothetical protein